MFFSIGLTFLKQICYENNVYFSFVFLSRWILSTLCLVWLVCLCWEMSRSNRWTLCFACLKMCFRELAFNQTCWAEFKFSAWRFYSCPSPAQPAQFWNEQTVESCHLQLSIGTPLTGTKDFRKTLCALVQRFVLVIMYRHNITELTSVNRLSFFKDAGRRGTSGIITAFTVYQNITLFIWLIQQVTFWYESRTFS